MPTAVAAALGVVGGFGGPGVTGPHGDRTATEAELVVLFTEAERFAPIASGWCGFPIPPEVVYPVGTLESCWRNLCRHCRGGGPENRRSAGYFALTVPVVAESGRALGLAVPRRSDFRDQNAWREAVCDWTVRHPIAQVQLLLHRQALYLRRTRGDLWEGFSVYRWGETGHRDYPAECRRIWRQKFRSWPAEGRLPRQGL